jgi:threonylcarbamoyladenosine tRNA methylthiotransferase MtaB
MKKASLHTLGCRLNQAETAIIAKSLKDSGFHIVEFGEPADLTVINTCTVTEQADAKCRQAVRKTLRNSPDTFVAVVGCYAQMAVDTIRKIKGVDLIIGNEHKIQLVNYLDGLIKKEDPLIIHSPKLSRGDFSVETVGFYDNATRANLKIQDGCNFVCSFCIIPTARGPARSRKFENILDEARQLIDMGHKELVLTGVNIGTYNNDNHSIIDIIARLININGLRRLRISSIEPTTIPNELVQMIAESDKICKHLHIPLQSGDDFILKRMRRKYTATEVANFIEFVSEMVPNIGIGTDVMVGFPGESDESFITTKKFLTDLPVSYYHVFTYSDRKGTVSYRLADKVDHHIKKWRTRVLIEQGERKKRAFYEKYIGSAYDVLFEQKIENGYWVGYTSNYMNIEVKSGKNLHNKILPVCLIESTNRALIGELIE